MGFIGDILSTIQKTLKASDSEVKAAGEARPSQEASYAYSTDCGGTYISELSAVDVGLCSRYQDYKEMDLYPYISSALDIYADDATQPDSEVNRTIWVTSKDKNLENELNRLLHDVLKLDVVSWEITRYLCKMGNDFEEILVTDDGVVGLNFLPAPSMRRIEDMRGALIGFLQSFSGRFDVPSGGFRKLLDKRLAGNLKDDEVMHGTPIPFEDWEVVHFRLRSKDRGATYGYSVLDSARWIWRRLLMLEDAAVLYRLQRAPERFAFYVDVGNIPSNEIISYLNKFRQQFKKKKFINPRTGKLDLKLGAAGGDDDFFIPTRAGQDGTRVEVLGAPQWQCLTGDTRIPLTDGTSPTIEDLSKRGDSFWVYSMDLRGRVVPGRGYNARVSHESAKIYEVGLDNGKTVRCTGNHPFLTIDRQWVLAEDLQEGQILMPLCGHINVSFVREVEGTHRVFDLTVEDYHNFAIEQGVFVHNSMDDIEFFHKHLFAAMKIPKAYLGSEEGVVRAVLSSEDVRFARTVLRVQREFKAGVQHIIRVHMAALGMKLDSSAYQLHMTVPSSIFELSQLEVRNARADLAARMADFVSIEYILSNIFKLSDEDIKVIFKQREQEAKIKMKYQSPPGAMENVGNSVAVRSALTGVSAKPLTKSELDSSHKVNKEKLDSIIKADTKLSAKLEEIGLLLRDIKSVVN